MQVSTHQPADKVSKFIYKRLGIRFHRYLYKEGKSIEFIDTEIPETGQRRDITVKVDDNHIRITEFMSKALDDDKLNSMFDYHESIRCDVNYQNFGVKSGLLSSANPNHGKRQIRIDNNITFKPETIFTKNRNGWEVLNTSINKVIIQEEFCDDEAIDLLMLPDMTIDLPINVLMKAICVLINHAVIPDKNFKNDIINCEIQVLKRFFDGDELSGMVKMLRLESENPERMRIIEKYGQGYDLLYFDAQYETRLEDAKSFIRCGVDLEIISKALGYSIEFLEKIKKEL